MAKRTKEEIVAQRDAWLARKTARDAGQDIPILPPLLPGEEPPELETAAASTSEPEAAAPAPEAEAAPPAPSPEPTQPAPAPETVAPVAKPTSPQGKRSPEEIAAQREAFLAARAAKAAGQAASAPAAPAPAAEKVAAPPAPKPTDGQPAAAPAPKPQPARPARAPRAAPAEPEPAGTITRREFLNYAWLASIALFTVETVGISLWFAFPNFLEGQFGSAFPIGQATEVLPQVNAPPIPFHDGKFWLVNLDTEGPNGEPRQGILALYKVCTHLGCLYDWADVTSRFECPCHGSKFSLTGDYLEGPAPRNLDRFVIRAISPDGAMKESADGEPLQINGDEQLVIDTGNRIQGATRA
jgi:cytochrome b6-f complex iron-sulfur subunit